MSNAVGGTGAAYTSPEQKIERLERLVATLVARVELLESRQP